MLVFEAVPVPYGSWSWFLGSCRVFPKNGFVGGPGGRCALRLPHLHIFTNKKTKERAVKKDAFSAMLSMVIVESKEHWKGPSVWYLAWGHVQGASCGTVGDALFPCTLSTWLGIVYSADNWMNRNQRDQTLNSRYLPVPYIAAPCLFALWCLP